MTRTITVDYNILDKILSRLEELNREVEDIRKVISTKELKYGSDEWWKLSDKEAIEEIKSGKGMKFESVDNAIKWLKS